MGWVGGSVDSGVWGGGWDEGGFVVGLRVRVGAVLGWG